MVNQINVNFLFFYHFLLQNKHKMYKTYYFQIIHFGNIHSPLHKLKTQQMLFISTCFFMISETKHWTFNDIIKAALFLHTPICILSKTN